MLVKRRTFDGILGERERERGDGKCFKLQFRFKDHSQINEYIEVNYKELSFKTTNLALGNIATLTEVRNSRPSSMKTEETASMSSFQTMTLFSQHSTFMRDLPKFLLEV